jgi:lipopolysaccharide biosynthesis glycosyltransferase
VVFGKRNAGAAFVRTRVRPAVQRGLTHVAPVDRAVTRAMRGRDNRKRLLAMYEGLRRAYARDRVPAEPVPSAAQVDTVAQEALRAEVYFDFFEELSRHGDLQRALVHTTRRFVDRGEQSRARIFLQVLQRSDGLGPIADVCLALCALVEPIPDAAWTLFTRTDLALVLRWAANEYFELAFARDAGVASASLGHVLNGDVELDTDADTWLKIAYYAFAAGAFDVVAPTLKCAELAFAKVRDQARLGRLEARRDTLADWLDRAARAGRPVEVPPGEIPFALVGFKHPDWRAMSTHLDDPTETLAVLGHLLRHDGVQFCGEAGLVAAADWIRRDAPAAAQLTAASATVRLVEVERDASRYAQVPDGTWAIVSEWFSEPLGGVHYDIPLDPRLRPVFVSFHITPPALKAPGAIESLRRHGPVGCRDWDTVFLLLAAGVPAFFAGALTATVDLVVPPGDPGEAGAAVTARQRTNPAVRDRDLGDNLVAAAETLRQLRGSAGPIRTPELRFYLAARALGVPAELRVKDAGNYRTVDYLELSDADFAAMQRGISDKLAAVLGALLAGRAEDEVYEAWRTACAADVARAEAELHSVTSAPEPNFDIDKACATIRAASVAIERSAPAPAGLEINVEFSVDENYKHQLEIVVDSIVQRSTRPLRAFVLCRGLGRPDFDRMAGLFPGVSFVWLPTDNVDYGPIPEKIKWATIVTMDRTMLPVLLGDVDRIIHFDLDALCLHDLAELFDLDMAGTAIAAVDAPQPVYLSGLDTFRRAARRMRREGKRDIARELIIRTHSQHAFDFEIFNAGIMVLDLAKMRADDVCARYLGYIQRFGLNGQVIMNLYVGGRRTKVDADWNRLVRLEVAEPPKIAHWAGPFKPWRGHPYVSGRELWTAQERHFAARTGGLSAAAEAG